MKLKSQGFTLAELLIALAILGVIATFTIPKVLQASDSSKLTAVAKEAASMVSGAHSAYQLTTAISTATTTASLTQFMNYVSWETGGTVKTAGDACAAADPCLMLHNGGVLQYKAAQAYTAGTTASHYINFNLDPDGTGTATEISFLQYANGRLTTGGNATGTIGSAGTTLVTTDPSYLTDWE